ncbi:glycosyltransferase family 87 protein [Cryobacterium sp. PH31-AA6]|uniref:glycosyltransferase family 87 protein n=1 Tax=Cryobacterium sp. PH31-AA6 TaxID=3046205 RepID=UPI0024BB67B3|nr:glycosyltransferase family 87 protein [Cryobacterium sp. PH31-AA6]MDJ0325304.1 glycosyltransferase family 87 protein [Cryobacterium sp. PH31-AA6]
MRITVVSLLLAASAVLTGLGVRNFDLFSPGRDTGALLVTLFALWALFAAAVIVLRGVRGRAVVVLILAGSVGIGAAAMIGPPNTSTDSARYAWDGIVSNSGISPYAFVPADPTLDSLRTDWLFPAPKQAADGTERCVGERIQTVHRGEPDDLLCSALNRTTVPTIYPPAAELYFAGVRAVTGPGPAYWPLQLTGLLLSVGSTVMLLFGMRRRGIDLRLAALWAWCPLVASEAVTNSHVDILGVVFTLAAAFLVTRERYWRGGIALGAAIATKLIPVIAAPALLRRQGWKVTVAAIATFLLLYVPYVLTTGIGVLGYLPGYLTEEGYQDGTRFALVSLVAPGESAIVVAGILLAAVAALTVWKTDPARPWLGQLVMIGSTLVILSPRYPWYALLLVPFVALSGRWEWLAVPLALSIRMLVPSLQLTRATLFAAVILIVVMSLRRAGPGAGRRLLARLPFRNRPARGTADTVAPQGGRTG